MVRPNNDIVLYHYSYSPFARRITAYLAFRGIDYAQCMQPAVLPRPDVNALGVAYRRIPLMAIGRDVYCDSRLILRRLEQIFPKRKLGASNPDQMALEKLLDHWTVNDLFMRAGPLLPNDLPLLRDPKFTSDRKDYTGTDWEQASREALRPESLAQFRDAFTMLETTLLADGREWILKTEKPSLADIEAIWPFHWLTGIEGAFPRELISQDQYPRVYAWISRFHRAYKAARSVAPEPATLDGSTATQRVLGAEVSTDIHFDDTDPSGLAKDQQVEVWPMDTGFNHRDRGGLQGINQEEIVIRVQAQDGKGSVHLHVPRVYYRVRAVQEQDPARL